MKGILTLGVLLAPLGHCFAQSFTLLPNSANSNALNTTSNRVGVNIVSPSTELHINRSGNVGVQMQFSNANTSTSTNDGLWLGIDADGNGLLNQKENATFGLKRNGVDKMLFKTDDGIDFYSPLTKLYQENSPTKFEVETTNGDHSSINLKSQGGIFSFTKYKSNDPNFWFGVSRANLSLVVSEVDLLINSSRHLYLVPSTQIAVSLSNEGKMALNMGTTLASRTLDVNGDVRFGENGTGINAIINKAVLSDLPSIAAQSSHIATFTVNGATMSGVYNSVNVSPTGDLSDGLIIEYARVSGLNEVEVKFRNTTNSAINMGFMTYAISLIQWKTTEN